MSTYSDLAGSLSVVSSYGDERMALCPFHDDSNASLQFNVVNGLYICFSCGAKGSAKKLAAQLGRRLTEELDVADIRRRLDALKAGREVEAVLSESVLGRYAFPTPYWGPCPDDCGGSPGCSDHRGLTQTTVDAFDLGYDPLTHVATIPTRNASGDLLGIIRRSLGPDVTTRYKYPRGFKRSSHLFGSWMVEHDEDCDTVALVEGPLDAIRVWQAGYSALACYGNSISPAQVRALRRLGIVSVILFGDNDRGGQTFTNRCLGVHEHRDRRGRIVRQEYLPETDLRRAGFLVGTVQWSRRMPKDPGAMTDEQITNMLDNALTEI